ncbi:unnamed protein product [Blepharisma stoltei]|uniref:WD repeat-containing protein 36 n=1 Tax=Blepharisma stoltei TaxID=1481888 RepID=A0AAU9JZ91_9CILI|nr:unnamed protein product [Blepharisma stoltei]
MSEAIFEVHRTLGLTCGDMGFVWHKDDPEPLISLPVAKSYITYYAGSLKIRYLGPQFEHTVNSVASYKDLILVAAGNTISAWHKVKQEKVFSGSKSAISEIFVFGDYLLALNFSAELLIWNAESAESLGKMALVHEGLIILHPPTYLNKIILALKGKQLLLINVKTQSTIYNFPKITNHIDSEITSLEHSPALDVIAVGLENGKIIFADILHDNVLFELTQNGAVTSISFCTHPGKEKLATGNSQGQVHIWDLPEQRLQATISAHPGFKVDKVFFPPGEPLLITSSGPDNSLKQWVFEFSDPEPRLLKQRSGFNSSPHHIRFYNPQHILACSNNSLRDLSILNEHQSTDLSVKHIHKAIKKSHIQFSIKNYKSFDFSETREKDWCNILTCHKNQKEPLLWSYENKVLGQKPIEVKQDSEVTATCVSPCGNYGVAGFASGKLEKFNMQSGLHQFEFKGEHSSQLVGVCIDALNRIMISSSSSELVFWDFLSGKLLKRVQLAGQALLIELDRFSNMLAVVMENLIVLYDIRSGKITREFAASGVKDLSFSYDSRWLAACEEKTIKVWDIPSSRLIEWLQFDSAPVSLAFAPSGEFLATAHEGCLGVYLWMNKAYFQTIIIEKSPKKPRKIKGFEASKGKNIYSSKFIDVQQLVTQPNELPADSITQFDKLPEVPDHSSIKTSDIPYHRIQALYNLDDIKERNKPIKPPKKPEKVPFFLPDSLNIVKAQVPTQEDDKPRKKIKFDESDLTPHLQHSSESVTNYLKTLSPGKIELNILTLSDEEVPLFTSYLLEALKSSPDYDFLQSILACFLRIHGDKLSKTQASSLSTIQTEKWEHLESQFMQDLSGLERLLPFYYI